MGVNKTALMRLEAFVDRKGPTECWGWKGTIGTWGYGQFWLNGKSLNASRAAYILWVGPVDTDKVVCHSCDRPECCNPAHLWVGTQADNLADCRKKGRARGQFQSATHPRHVAKLTPETIREAKLLYSSGMTQTAIGKLFGVDSSVISRLVTGKTFKNVA